ncbi:MAG TPA: TonB-dependent receptor [Pseudomonadota bacterium]|nr:TonB-dependent receptor [Pseudomonadota bacterium]
MSPCSPFPWTWRRAASLVIPPQCSVAGICAWLCCALPMAHAESSFDVVVRAEDPALRAEVSKQTLHTEELRKMPGTLGDPLRAIENLPGAARPPLNTGLFIIEGARPSDSRVYLATAEVPQLYHYGGFTSVVPADFLSSVTYLPHNFGVRYGRATAGTIDVDLRAGKTDRWHAALDVNPIHVGVEVEGPLPPRNAQTQQPSGSILLGLRRSYVDAGLAFVGAVLGDPPGLRFVNAPVYWDYQAVLKYALAGGTLRVMVLGADDQISLKFARPQDVDPSVNGTFATHILFHRLQLRYQRQFSGWDVLFQSTSGYTQTDLDLGRTVSMSVKTLGNDFRVEAIRQITPQYRLFFGTDVQTSYVWLSAAVPSPVREGEFQKPPGSLSQVVAQAEAYFVNPALYAELSAQLHPRVSVVSGVRFDYFGFLRRYSIDPRLSGKVVLTPITQLKWGAGLYSQDPAVQDYFSSFGNRELRLERAVHLSLAVEQAIWKGLVLELTGLYKYLWDFAGTSTLSRRFGGGENPLELQPERTASQVHGRIFGGTLLLRQSLSKYFFGWVSYSLLRSERADCPSCSYRLFDFDQTHILIVAAHAYLPYKFEIGLRFRYISGIPQTPVRGGFFDSDTDLYQPIPASERNTDRLAPFHQLDLRIDRTFVTKKMVFKLYLDVSNVYNSPAQEQLVYSYDYSQRAAITGLPILPSLGVRGEL